MGHKQTTLQLQPAEAKGPTVNQPLHFFRIPVSKRMILIRTTYTSLEPMLVEVEHGGEKFGLIVHYCFGPKPSMREILKHLDEYPLEEHNYYVYAEGRTPEEAWKNYQASTPAAQLSKDPAIRLDKRRGKMIEQMPACYVMKQEKTGIFCQTRLDQGLEKPACRCFVEHGWPPRDCPIAQKVGFDPTDLPLPYSAEAPF